MTDTLPPPAMALTEEYFLTAVHFCDDERVSQVARSVFRKVVKSFTISDVLYDEDAIAFAEGMEVVHQIITPPAFALDAMRAKAESLGPEVPLIVGTPQGTYTVQYVSEGVTTFHWTPPPLRTH